MIYLLQYFTGNDYTPIRTKKDSGRQLSGNLLGSFVRKYKEATSK
jgi:hypothetical protein